MDNQHPIQIFISYASQDQERVLEVYSYLIQKVHPRIWMDCKNLLPGQQWEPEILKNLRQSEIILFFISEVSVEKRGVVQRELNLVLKYLDEKLTDDIYIIPVKLDSQALVPDKLNHLQWVDLNAEGALASIENAIRSQLEKLDKPVFKSVSPESDIQISKRVFTERWEGLPGYDGRFAIPVLHSARFDNMHEISRIVEASFIKILHDYRNQKFYQEPDMYDWSQPSFRRMNWFDAQLPISITKITS
jgi:hypothetical protein